VVERNEIKLIAVGGSYGALEAMKEILSNLSKECSIPIAAVFHRNRDSKEEAMVEYLSKYTTMKVKEISDNEEISSGILYFAPGGYHLLLENRSRFILYLDEAINYNLPSIDLFFESASDVFGSELLGILLSGANRDGAFGLCHIQKRGGTTIIQKPSSALSPTMPESALEICEPDRIEEPIEIAEIINKFNGDKNR